MEISEEKKNDVMLLRMKGRLDAVTSPSTEKQVGKIIDSGNYKVLMDFGGIDYLSSAGMRMLLVTTRKASSHSGYLVLYAIAPNIAEVLKMSGFDRLLKIAKDESEAMQKLS